MRFEISIGGEYLVREQRINRQLLRKEPFACAHSLNATERDFNNIVVSRQSATIFLVKITILAVKYLFTPTEVK